MVNNTSAPSEPAITPERLMQLAWGYAPPLIIEAAIRHNIFELLEADAMTINNLAAKTGASPRGLKAILNALVGFQFLTKSTDGKYANAPEASAFLVPSKPGYFGGMIRHTSEQLLPKWLGLNDAVKTGKPREAVNLEGEGSQFFGEFVADIFPMSYPAARNLANVLDVAKSAIPVSVLDIASGSGVWGIALAQSSPHVKVTAIDWPHILEVTKQITQRFGVGDRFTYSSGDLLEADFGTGHDVATLGHILHSEGEHRSKRLLKRVFDVLAPGGTIVIAEMVPDTDRSGPAFPLLFAVNMLVFSEEGDTFTFDEMTGWLNAIGFVDAHTIESPGPSPLLIATKPA